MIQFMLYLLASILTSALLLGYYWVALRNRGWHRFNRAYLLASLVLSILFPLEPINWSPLRPRSYGTIKEYIFYIGSKGTKPMEHHPLLLCIALILPWVVSIFLLARSTLRILKFCRLKRECAVCRMDGYDLIETHDPRAPFSFLDNLFWHAGYDIADPLNRRILLHELAHIRGRHTWDNLFAQTLCCFCWMNPLMPIIRKELSMVHEFIADAAACDHGDAEGFARMLLRAHNQGLYLEPARAFFHSPIKRRIAMITNFQSSGNGVAQKLLVLPVLALGFVVFSCTKEKGVRQSAAVTVQAKSNLDRVNVMGLDIRNLTKSEVDSITAGQIKSIEITGIKPNDIDGFKVPNK